MGLVCGWGINDSDYAVQPVVNGKQVVCPFYRTWKSMVERCYSDNKYPTYVGRKVCSEWKSFMAFKSWMETQSWEGRQLDKDLLGEGSLYSPDTCCFVEPWLNYLFNAHGRGRGNYPIGVSLHKASNKYQAELSVNGKQKYLGRFHTIGEASASYESGRRIYVESKMKDYPDQRIKQAVLEKLNDTLRR